MNYQILAHKHRVIKTLDKLPDSERKNRVKNIKNKLEENPFPGEGRGNIKKVRNLGLYRLHIGEDYTALYRIDKDEREVKILDLVTRQKAYKRYGESGRT
jgi:mRNA-degrading endonuclease RelE of RelBE toxin-antitoxin system